MKDFVYLSRITISEQPDPIDTILANGFRSLIEDKEVRNPIILGENLQLKSLFTINTSTDQYSGISVPTQPIIPPSSGELTSFSPLNPITYIFVIGFLVGTWFTKYVLKP